MPCGRTHASWLRQVEGYFKDTAMRGPASAAWTMAKQMTEYRCEVDAVTRYSGCALMPIIYTMLYFLFGVQ